MAQTRNRSSTVSLGALNIVTHPHSTKGYVNLFKASFDAQPKSGFKLFGDYHGLVQSVFEIHPGEPERGLEGELVRFIEISPNDPWFNVDKAELATPSERKEIVIPNHLRPKMRGARYIFFPKEHRLVFLAKKSSVYFAPSFAKTLLENFLNSPKKQEFPIASVTVEQSRNALREILQLYYLKKLVICLHQPNADEGDETELSIMRELKEQRIETMNIELTADNAEGLLPNKRNRLYAHLAVSNGSVEGTGRNHEGSVVKINTEDRPVIEPFKAKLSSIDIVSFFRQKAREFLDRLVSKDQRIDEEARK